MLDLDHEEREILVDLLETRLADLRMEVGLASSMTFRDILKKRKHVLEKTIACLRQAKNFLETTSARAPRL